MITEKDSFLSHVFALQFNINIARGQLNNKKFKNIRYLNWCHIITATTQLTHVSCLCCIRFVTLSSYQRYGTY